MLFGEYCGDDSHARGETGLVIASIYEAGEVANVIYYSGSKPLALVPKRFFTYTPSEAARLSNSQRNKRTTIFMVGDNVEFELVPGSSRIVQWIRKCPEVLDVFLLEETNKFVTKAKAVIPPTNVKRGHFWAKEFGWISFGPELLEDYGDVYPEVPMNITISIDISFGEHENANMFMLDEFRPTYSYRLYSIESVSKNVDLLRFAPWKQMTDFGSEYELVSPSTEISMKSEEDFRDYGEEYPEVHEHVRVSSPLHSVPEFEDNKIRNKPWRQMSDLESDHDLDPASAEISLKSEEEYFGRSESSQSANTAGRIERCEEPKISEKVSTSKKAKSKMIYSHEEMDHIKSMVPKMRLPFFFHDGKDAGCTVFPHESNAAGDGIQENTGITSEVGDLLMTWYMDGFRAGFQKGRQLGKEPLDSSNVGFTGH